LPKPGFIGGRVMGVMAFLSGVGGAIHILSILIGVLSPKEKERQALRLNRHSREGGNPELFLGIL